MVKQISDNEIYLLIKYIKSIFWRVAKHLSYIEDARCLKVNVFLLEMLNNQDPILCFKSIILVFLELMNVMQNYFNVR